MNYYQLIFKCDYREKEFYEGRTYIFKSDLQLEKGDYVVAQTRHGYQIAVIYEKNDVEAKNDVYGENIAKIITKLDGNYYKEKERAEELKRIEYRLNQKAKNISKIMQYETLAKYDNESKELLEKYKELTNEPILISGTAVEENEETLPF